MADAIPSVPLLLIVGGSNGAGKSTFAVPYAAQRGLPLLNADELTTLSGGYVHGLVARAQVAGFRGELVY